MMMVHQSKKKINSKKLTNSGHFKKKQKEGKTSLKINSNVMYCLLYD